MRCGRRAIILVAQCAALIAPYGLFDRSHQKRLDAVWIIDAMQKRASPFAASFFHPHPSAAAILWNKLDTSLF
jgi:hypothetical protein